MMRKIGMLASLLLSAAMCPSQGNGTLSPVGYRVVSLKGVPLERGDRIEEIELTVAGASFDSAHIPIDWSFNIGVPISGVATLKASAAHGVGMPFTFSGFQRFVTLALYDYGEWNAPLAISGKVTLYNDGAERTIDLKKENIVVEKSNQSPDPTPAAVTTPAGQESRHA